MRKVKHLHLKRSESLLYFEAGHTELTFQLEEIGIKRASKYAVSEYDNTIEEKMTEYVGGAQQVQGQEWWF